jgi:dolichol-phosphate mannosyltransferase
MPDLQANIRALHGPILVTAASGFVGATLFKTLAGVRDDVYAVVRRGRNWRLAEVRNEQLIAVDLNDYAATKNLVDGIGPQTVFHCAAYGAYSFEQDAGLMYQTNFQSIVDLTGLLAKRTCAAFIHAGSSSEYGGNCSAPSEDAACLPNSHYAVSKTAVASYLQYMGKYRNFPCANLRLYAVYGPYEDTSRLIPTLLHNALAGNLPPFVDARTSRDFIHIDNVYATFICAATAISPKLYGESYKSAPGQATMADLGGDAAHFGVKRNRFGGMEGRAWDLPLVR